MRAGIHPVQVLSDADSQTKQAALQGDVHGTQFVGNSIASSAVSGKVAALFTALQSWRDARPAIPCLTPLSFAQACDL